MKAELQLNNKEISEAIKEYLETRGYRIEFVTRVHLESEPDHHPVTDQPTGTYTISARVEVEEIPNGKAAKKDK